MPKYVVFSIVNLEDVKMGTSGAQYDAEYALSYIAGSSIRGAYINKYMKKYKLKDIEGKHKEKLLKGQLKFLNAYLEVDKERTKPFPLCFYAEKDKLKNFKDGVNVLNAFEQETKLMIRKESYDRVKLHEFCIYDDEYEGVKIKKSMNLHITTQKEKRNLFRYEALTKGQKFQGIIEAEDEEIAKECKEILKDSIFYFGGSKGSGYGKCKITSVKIEDYNPEIKDFNVEDFDKGKIYILALSNIISIDEFGRNISYIDKDYLEDKLNIKDVKLNKSIIETVAISGYNNKWMCRTPKIHGIKQGSVFEYTFKGKLDNEKTMKLMDEGIGDRTEEGYGRILILNHIDGYYLENYREEKNNITIPKELDNECEKQLKNILNNIYKNKIEKDINTRILNLNSKLKKEENYLSSTQWGKIMENAKNCSLISCKKGKEKFKKYLEHIKNEKGTNKEVYTKYTKTKINDISLYDFLMNFINNSDNVKEFKNKCYSINRIKICGIEAKLTEEYVYKNNMIFLEQFANFQRMKAKEGEH